MLSAHIIECMQTHVLCTCIGYYYSKCSTENGNKIFQQWKINKKIKKDYTVREINMIFSLFKVICLPKLSLFSRNVLQFTKLKSNYQKLWLQSNSEWCGMDARKQPNLVFKCSRFRWLEIRVPKNDLDLIKAGNSNWSSSSVFFFSWYEWLLHICIIKSV